MTKFLVACSFTIFSLSLFADSIEKPYSVEKRIQDAGMTPDIRLAGAHGSHNPHAKLTPEMHIQVALQHKFEGRMGEAISELDQAIATNTQSAELFAVRGSLHLEQNNLSQALRDLESALSLAPDSTAILTNRAQVYLQFGRVSEALQDLDKAIQHNPDLMAAYFNRGSIHFSSAEYKLALQDFDSCISIDPHAAGPYFNRASTKDALGDKQGAIEDLKRFIEITDNTQWKTTAQKLIDDWQTVKVTPSLDKSDS